MPLNYMLSRRNALKLGLVAPLTALLFSSGIVSAEELKSTSTALFDITIPTKQTANVILADGSEATIELERCSTGARSIDLGSGTGLWNISQHSEILDSGYTINASVYSIVGLVNSWYRGYLGVIVNTCTLSYGSKYCQQYMTYAQSGMTSSRTLWGSIIGTTLVTGIS